MCLITNVRKMILNLEKKTYFKKHLLINVQQNILPRLMKWLRDATNALEQEDSLLNKGLNNSFLNYNRCFFSKFKIPLHTFVIRHIQIIPNDSHEFLKQCDIEAFLKLNICLSTEFAR